MSKKKNLVTLKSPDKSPVFTTEDFLQNFGNYAKAIVDFEWNRSKQEIQTNAAITKVSSIDCFKSTNGFKFAKKTDAVDATSSSIGGADIKSIHDFNSNNVTSKPKNGA